jgi:hypothetical protein
MFEHRIQDHPQFPHAGRPGDLLCLARRTEALIARTDHLIETCGDHRGHGPRRPDLGRPPQTVRFPRHVPRSRFSGATPTNAAICLPVKVPGSGRFTSSVVDNPGPAGGRAFRCSKAGSHPQMTGRQVRVAERHLDIAVPSQPGDFRERSSGLHQGGSTIISATCTARSAT